MRYLGSVTLLLLALWGTQVSAAPVATSLSASSYGVKSEYIVSLAWTVTNGTGHSLLFSCPLGVTVRTVDGGVFPCNTRQAASVNPSDAVGFIFTNVSGTLKNVMVTLYPKDANGDNDSGAASIALTIDPVPQPITEVTVSSLTPASDNPVTITWKGVGVPGVNVQFDCSNALKIMASGIVDALPCGTPAFSSDLAQSGSITVTPTNTSFVSAPLVVRIFPAMAPGIYDATHSLSVTLAVGPKLALALPAILSFSGSSNSIFSQIPFSFSWTTQNTAGVNVRFPCNSAYAVASLENDATTTLPCDTLAFSSALSPSGTTTMVVMNGSGLAQSFTATLLPQNNDGTYNGAFGRTIYLTVEKYGVSQQNAQSVSTPPTITQEIKTSAAAHAPFIQNLKRGSRGFEVTALQKFLTQNVALYPEGLATGYFGAATEQAVRRFQEKYGVAKKGDAGYGLVGPKTRAKFNSLQTP